MSWSVTRVAISSSILPMLWRCAAVGFGVRKGVVDRNVTVYLHGGKIRCRSRRLRLWQVRVQPKEAQQFQLGCILKIVAMIYMFWNILLHMYDKVHRSPNESHGGWFVEQVRSTDGRAGAADQPNRRSAHHRLLNQLLHVRLRALSSLGVCRRLVYNILPLR